MVLHDARNGWVATGNAVGAAWVGAHGATAGHGGRAMGVQGAVQHRDSDCGKT